MPGRVFLAGILAGVLSAPMVCWAKDGALADSPSGKTSQIETPLRFQRVMVPYDRPEEWPRNKDERYLPMSVDEFERRIAQLGGPLRKSEPGAAQFVRAEYRARLTGDDLVDGEAVWEFHHRGSQRAIVILEDS